MDLLLSVLFYKHGRCFCLVETWLCMDILDTEIKVQSNSTTMRISVKPGNEIDIVSYNVVLYGSAGLEVIVVLLSKCNFKLCLCVIYRQLSSPPAILTINYFLLNNHICPTLYYLATLISILAHLTVLSLAL